MQKTVIVLGAGPAGLAIGYELARRGIDFAILEKGNQAGASFARYPTGIFFGPWLNNTLPGSRVPWHWLLRRATQPAYTRYLEQYARLHHLPIDYGCQVLQVRKHGEQFWLHTSKGEMHCQHLVNCSGYYSTPNIPPIPGLWDNEELKVMHSADYRNAADVRGLSRVLVVGAGLTAGETMMELYQRHHQVSLSHRGPLKFGPSAWREALLSPLTWIAERAALALGLRLNSNPPMAGGESKKLIESGQVTRYPGIHSVRGCEVLFNDGQRAHFDAIVLATGYRYTAVHLHSLLRGPLQLDNLESVDVPNLWVLGLDQGRTYRSRFLRGIRSDARHLGNLIEQRLGLPIGAPERLIEILPLRDSEVYASV